MGTYTVAEVAARTGFSPSAVRYYDECGVVQAPARSAAGYRLYDDRSLERLAFVARAKRLGLRLDDITDLLGLWDGDECGPVQSRLAEMVRTKLVETRRGVTELSAFADELTALRDRLGGAPHPGQCDEDCPCLAEARHPVCTLDVEDRPARVAAWHSVTARAERRTVIDEGVRLVLPADPALLGEVAALAAAEQRCCAFLDFTLTFVDGRTTLDVRSRDGGAEVVAALFDAAPGRPTARR